MKSKPLKKDMVEKILGRIGYHNRGVAELMLTTGMRVGDAVAVKYGDFDKDGYIHYKAQKTNKSARVKPSEDFVKRILKYRKNDDAYIFPSPTVAGQHISRQAVWKAFKRACSECGVDAHGISPHSCRKTFAVDVYNKDGFGRAMASLQHSSPTTTMLYVFENNPFEEMQKEMNLLKKEVKTLKKSLKRVLYAVDLCCDKLIGDDSYFVTNEGRKALDFDLSDLDGNI